MTARNAETRGDPGDAVLSDSREYIRRMIAGTEFHRFSERIARYPYPCDCPERGFGTCAFNRDWFRSVTIERRRELCHGCIKRRECVVGLSRIRCYIKIVTIAQPRRVSAELARDAILIALNGTREQEENAGISRLLFSRRFMLFIVAIYTWRLKITIRMLFS